MDLFIADKALNKLGVLNDRTSLIWTRRYTKTGEFELHCPLTPHNLEFTQRGNIIYRSDTEEAGFINYQDMDSDSDGKEVLIARGSFLPGYLARRIIWGDVAITGSTESAMRALVHNNCISPSDTARIIPNLVLGNFNNYPETSEYQTSYKNLLDEIENLSTTTKLGHRIRLDIDAKQLVFEIYKGVDRTAGQSDNPRCIFSRDYNNVLSQHFTASDTNLRNFALVGGVGEGSERKFASVGTATGLDRYETFVDQASLSNEVDVVTYDTKTVETISAEEQARISGVKTEITQNTSDVTAKKAEIQAALVTYDQLQADQAAKQAAYNNNENQFTLDKMAIMDKYNASQITQAEMVSQMDAVISAHSDSEISYGSAVVVATALVENQERHIVDLRAELQTLMDASTGLTNQLEDKSNYTYTTTKTAVNSKIAMSDADYSALLAAKGNEALATMKEVLSFANTINPFSNQTYKTDFDLGDIVTCADEKWGVTLDTRITEISETYEESGMNIAITFGDELPTLIDKIKQIKKGVM